MARTAAGIIAALLAPLAATEAYGLAKDAAPAPPEKNCARMKVDTGCWRKIAGKDNCYFWHVGAKPDGPVTWTGICYLGKAVGEGTLAWKRAGATRKATGRFEMGFAHRRWEFHSDDGMLAKGRFSFGKPRGRWVFYPEDGTVTKGNFRKGKRHGRWVTRNSSGYRFIVDYRYGSLKGPWGTIESPHGDRINVLHYRGCFIDLKGRTWVSIGESPGPDCRR